MKALARKFDAALTFTEGETMGVIKLGPPPHLASLYASEGKRTLIPA
jgi:hypothetical protein